VLTNDNTTGPRIKANRPLTLNPGTNTEASQKHRPLITSENAPKLMMLSGNDRVDKIGRTAELKKPRTKAAIIAAGKFAKSTPGTIKSTTSKLRAVANNVKKVPNMGFPQVRFDPTFSSYGTDFSLILSVEMDFSLKPQ
jgi:hypothetical protein